MLFVMIGLTQWPPAWEVAVRVVAAGGVFVGDWFCVVFPNRVSWVGPRVELCQFPKIFLLSFPQSARLMYIIFIDQKSAYVLNLACILYYILLPSRHMTSK